MNKLKIKVDKSNKYKCLKEVPHILQRPDTFIGSTSPSKDELFIINNKNVVISKEIRFTEGLLKIFDEIVVNAIDHSVSSFKDKDSKNVTNISVTINKEHSSICVLNNGKGIPIEHTNDKFEKNIYVDDDEISESSFDLLDNQKVISLVPLLIPEMLFSKFRSGSNYDDDIDKITGGRNGFGAKLTNVYSLMFKVETQENGLYFSQEYYDNMSKI